jgi:hypothetical protein
MICKYSLKNGGSYNVQSPTPITDKQKLEIEQIICESSSFDCLLTYAQEQEIENAPLD